MKAAIYNPYLDTLGGGERYTFTFAKVLEDMGYKIFIEWKGDNISNKVKNRFAIETGNFNFVKDINKGSGFDLCFWVSDGSIPLLNARHNFIHFQIPFRNVNGKTLFNKMKLFRVDKVICNSLFTKKFIDEEFGINSIVLYPPVDVRQFKPKKKEKSILYVGRFSDLTQNKRQDILIKSFKKLNETDKDWKLILAGGVEVGADKLLSQIEEMVVGYPIQIIKSPNFELLKELYAKSFVFWAAAGFGIDENKNPDKVEHFGITLVEAMASGCIPLAFNAGGFKEIIKSGENGFIWRKEDFLIDKTTELIKNRELSNKIKKQGIESSQKYSVENFKNNIKVILES